MKITEREINSLWYVAGATGVRLVYGVPLLRLVIYGVLLFVVAQIGQIVARYIVGLWSK